MIGILLSIYIIVGALSAIVGLIMWLVNQDYGTDDEDARLGAQMFLLSPIWPVLVLQMIKEMLRYVRDR